MSSGGSNHPKISVHTPSNLAIVTEQPVPRGKAATQAVTWKFPNREKYKKTRLSIQGLSMPSLAQIHTSSLFAG